MRFLICPVCGEEWDLDDLHAEVAESAHKGLRRPFSAVVREFQRQGCGVALEAFTGPLACRPSTDPDTVELAEMAKMTYELLGADIDGCINEIEDYRLVHGL